MMIAGSVWAVPSGTKYKVISGGLLSSEVRILGGAHSGEACSGDRGTEADDHQDQDQFEQGETAARKKRRAASYERRVDDQTTASDSRVVESAARSS